MENNLKVQVDKAKAIYDSFKSEIVELETKKSRAYTEFIELRKKQTAINVHNRKEERNAEATEQRESYASSVNVVGSVLVGVNTLKRKNSLRKWTGAKCTGQINNDPDNQGRKLLVVEDITGNVRQVVMATFTGFYTAKINDKEQTLYLTRGEYTDKTGYDAYLKARPNLTKLIVESVQYAKRLDQPTLP